MLDDRKQFTFYVSYWDAIELLPKSQQLKALRSIIEYSLTGRSRLLYEQGKHSEAYAVFMALKDDLDKERREAAEGRRCSAYKVWRTSVYERDNYTCQMCNARGCRLNAHHIKSYARFPSLRYDVSNGVTLCESCHKFVHSRKGVAGKWHG